MKEPNITTMLYIIILQQIFVRYSIVCIPKKQPIFGKTVIERVLHTTLRLAQPQIHSGVNA